MFCAANRCFLFAVAVIVAVASAAKSGEECSSDNDCDGNLDCYRVNLRVKRCFPITCAKGAGQALLDYGFDADNYIATIKAETGLKRNRDFVSMEEKDNDLMRQALAKNSPPTDVFARNLTACMDMNTEQRQEGDSTTFYGLQWSGAALFSYFGKSTWGNADSVLGVEFDVQVISNCVGPLLGVDVGLDVLFQTFLEKTVPVPPVLGGDFDLQDFEFIPIVIAGPIGLQVGWGRESKPDAGQIIEVTLGPSLGAALGGVSFCFNEATSNKLL